MYIKRIVLVDAHKMMREGIKSLLENQLSYNVVAETDTVEEALELLKKIQVELIIIDVHVPAKDEISHIKQITSQYKNIRIIILTILNEAGYIRSFIQAGVKGYLLKSSGKEELFQAIEATIHGQTYFSEAVSKTIMMELVNSTQLKVTHKTSLQITDRESEILELIVKEYTNQEIAQKLFISVRTVDAHRRNLLEKTGARNTAGLVKFALEHMLLKDT